MPRANNPFLPTSSSRPGGAGLATGAGGRVRDVSSSVPPIPATAAIPARVSRDRTPNRLPAEEVTALTAARDANRVPAANGQGGRMKRVVRLVLAVATAAVVMAVAAPGAGAFPNQQFGFNDNAWGVNTFPRATASAKFVG